jgi:predicted porin
VRGREALGGGTAAVYTVEAGILNDTGVSDQNGRLFGRQAFVGLEGPLGRVTLGRQYNLVYETLADVGDPSWRHGWQCRQPGRLHHPALRQHHQVPLAALAQRPGSVR